MYKGEYKLNSNIHVVKDIPLEILGGENVEILKLSNTELKTDGIFMLKDSVAPDQLVP